MSHSNRPNPDAATPTTPNEHLPANKMDNVEPGENIIQALSIDNLIFGWEDNKLKVLLVKHSDGEARGKWALPGGWIRYDENLRDAAHRLLFDLTNVRDIYLEQLKAFGRVDRFPGNRVVTIAYYALVRLEEYESVTPGATALETSWHDIHDLPELVFDHNEIFDTGLAHLRAKVRHEPIGFTLLPKKFTLLQLQQLYETVLDVQLDKSNFRRKFAKMNLLIRSDEKQVGVAHRAANYYSFDPEVYERLTLQGFSFEV